MELPQTLPSAPCASVSTWVGRVISLLLAAFLTMSAVMKLTAGPEIAKGFEHLGIPFTLATGLGVLELTCVVAYLVPGTCVIGAILLTGYLGGAICTHLRIGEPYYIHIGIGVLVWLGAALRDKRLFSLIPWRT